MPSRDTVFHRAKHFRNMEPDRALPERPELADKPLIYVNKADNNEHQQFLKVVTRGAQARCPCAAPARSGPTASHLPADFSAGGSPSNSFNLLAWIFPW